MATILNDSELRKLIGTVIIDGDPTSVRPNSYVLRLGGEGEFLNAGKTFTLYGAIHDSLKKLEMNADTLNRQQGDASRSIEQAIGVALKEQASAFQNRWLIACGSMLLGLLGLVLSLTSNTRAFEFVRSNGAWIGIVLIVAAAVVIIMTVGRTPDKRPQQKQGANLSTHRRGKLVS